MDKVDDFDRQFQAAREYCKKNGPPDDISEDAKKTIENFEKCIIAIGANIDVLQELGENLLEIISKEYDNDAAFDKALDFQYNSIINKYPNINIKIVDALISGAFNLEALKLNEYIGIYPEFDLIYNLSKDTGYIYGALDILNNGNNRISSIDLINGIKKTAIRDFATSGAHSRHKESHECKAEVFKWADEHMNAQPSMDAAAQIIAKDVVPYKFRTVRQWLTEWKKLRSASTE